MLPITRVTIPLEKQISLWVSWIRINLIRQRNFWDLDPYVSGSWIWRKLCKLRPLARPFIVCDVGSGITTKFWHDDWTGLGPLLDIAGPLGPQMAGLHKNAVVRDAIRHGNWWFSSSRSRNPIISLLRQALPGVESLIDCQHDDTYLWKTNHHAPSNKFSSAKTWLAFNPPGPSVSWHKSVWFPNNIPKHAFICWVTAWNRLHTRDRLRNWGLSVPATCVLCNNSNESRDHLFFACDFSSDIWRFFCSRANLHPPSSFSDCLLWLHSSTSDSNLALIIKLSFQASVYAIWKERNHRIHTGSFMSSAQIIKEIQLTIRARLDPLSRSQRVTPPAVSLLSTWFRLFQFRGNLLL